VDRLTVALAVHAQTVVEDRVGADHPGAQFLANDLECFG